MCFLLLGITHFCPLPLPNSPLYVLAVLALHTWFHPKVPFSPTPPSSLLLLFWLLPESGLPGPRKTNTLPSLWQVSCFLLYTSFSYLDEIKTPGGASFPAQHQDSPQRATGMEHMGTVNTCPVFWFLLESAGSSSLLPWDTLTDSQNPSGWLCCRSSAFDYKPECGSWYFRHQRIEEGLIQSSSLNNIKALSFYDRGLQQTIFHYERFLVVRNNYILIKNPPTFRLNPKVFIIQERCNY